MKPTENSALLFLLLPFATLARRGLLAHETRQSPPENPVTRVVGLLKDLQASLEKEAKEDEEVYEKLACWCETNDKAKTKSIADAEKLLTDLDATIEKFTALSASLPVDVDALEKEIAQNRRSLETAIALRGKQKQEFLDAEKEIIQAIRALDSAVVVLSKHHGGGAAALLSSVMKEVNAVAEKHGEVLQGVITPSQKLLLASFMQGGKQPDYFGSSPTFKQAYQPQSGEIFGILNQMKQTFEADLSASQKDELDAQRTYDDMKAAKEAEILAGQSSLQEKKEQLATAEERLVTAKSEKEDTETALAADKKFLIDLKHKCSLTDDEWERRQQMRSEEMQAVAKAIAILSKDDARDLFFKTLGGEPMTRFVQLRSQTRRSLRSERAAQILEAAANKTHNPKLAALATAARLDPFTRVKKAIDDMVAGLLEDKADEAKERDWCIDELAKNERQTAKQEHTKGSLETKIDALHMSVANMNETVLTLEQDVVNLNASKAKAKEDRETEAAEFRQVVADQQKTQALLTEALGALKEVYAAGAAGLLQKRKQAPPPTFTVYEKRGEAPPVIALIEHIIQGSKAMETEAVKDEEAAQDEYMKFKNSVQDAIEAKQSSIIDRKRELAELKEDLLLAKRDLGHTVSELETLSNNLAGLHTSCDFLIKNFQVRQEARDQEVDALRQAKAFLSGMQSQL